MKKDLYKLDNSVERIERGKCSLFLDRKELMDIKPKLKNINYNIFYLYEDSDKVIIYNKELPDITVFKIECANSLRHQDIMGSLFSLGIDSSYIGDIIKYNNNFYFYVLTELSNYIYDNFKEIGNNKIKLVKYDFDYLKDYKREYETITIIESSTRIDAVVSSLSKLSRREALEKFKNKEVILNYNVVTNNTYNLKENDVFSIRKIGKFKYKGIVRSTNKDKLVLEIDKYK